MSRESREPSHPLSGLLPARPPASARERILLAAQMQPVDESPLATLWERLWESRPLRMAWATTTVALLVAHTLLSVPRSGGHRTLAAITGTIAGTPEREVVQLAALPPVLPLPAGFVGGGSGRTSDTERRNETPPEKDTTPQPGDAP